MLDQLRHLRTEFTGALLAPLTRSGYSYDWGHFETWCEAAHLVALPADPETVGLYVTARLASGMKVSSVSREVAGISHRHRTRGMASPITSDVHALLRGARRLVPQTTRQMLPLSVEDVRAISLDLIRTGTARAIRDRALILVGFASALRSASLVALLLEDVAFSPQGVTLAIRREKQDQLGKGRLVGLPHGHHPETCPVLALRAWLDVRGAEPGRLFTHTDGCWRGRPVDAQRVCLIVQACLRRIGRSSKNFGSHSLRAGLVTEAGLAGASELLIATQTGHHDMSVLRQYFRRRDAFAGNVCGLLGL